MSNLKTSNDNIESAILADTRAFRNLTTEEKIVWGITGQIKAIENRLLKTIDVAERAALAIPLLQAQLEAEKEKLNRFSRDN